ncbi:DUF3892 domain-containing protein [Saccharibacillus sp. CPCC 101409]|uniref:DUF3892 domain-containing protein n=1 Tax=Saccharibacillus sp. CPCC 101409 TaxID=3058041 RepID=UPI002671FD34|nr:DUF3892 domain-containing protein [Saccharibacillus sp. CPCC 101409]MDO3409699.1 DUF3892 domain-containing protein [Saccharibacillus sp. CPCC 101409]
MASRHEVLCVNKRDRYNPHEKIMSIGGKNQDGTRWKVSQERAITGIESGEWSFFVSKGGHTVNVIVATSRYGNKYLKTETDGENPNNLLSLAECPL